MKQPGKVFKTQDDVALEEELCELVTGERSFQIAYVPGEKGYMPSPIEIERWAEKVRKEHDAWLVCFDHGHVETMYCHQNGRTGVLNRSKSIYFSC